MHWFRGCARRIAATLLVSVIALGGSMAAPHEDDCHDSACHPGAVPHDASAHAFSAPNQAEASHPLHCLVCHWARSFRPYITATFVATPAAYTGICIHLDLITVARRAQVAQPPLRSPPSSPFLG